MNHDSLFSYENVYCRGHIVMCMLRSLAPSDDKFFQVLQTYQSNYALGNANTANLKKIAERIYGFSLDNFFDQWVYGRGHAIYAVSFKQAGTAVSVKLNQSTSCPSYTPHFDVPLQILLRSASGDTIVKVYNTLDDEIFTFNWAPYVNAVIVNPEKRALCKQPKPAKRVASLNVGTLEKSGVEVFPNPTADNWQISNVPKGTEYTLTDMGGKVLLTGKSNDTSIIIPGQKLPGGMYLLNLNNEETIQLIHW
jgi:aminopeptidase N